MPDNQRPRCFIDTNVWLYAFIEADDTAKSATARTLIQETQPVISTQVINEVCVNLLRRASFTEEQISRLIESFYEKYSLQPTPPIGGAAELGAVSPHQQESL